MKDYIFPSQFKVFADHPYLPVSRTQYSAELDTKCDSSKGRAILKGMCTFLYSLLSSITLILSHAEGHKCYDIYCVKGEKCTDL